MDMVTLGHTGMVTAMGIMMVAIQTASTEIIILLHPAVVLTIMDEFQTDRVLPDTEQQPGVIQAIFLVAEHLITLQIPETELVLQPEGVLVKDILQVQQEQSIQDHIIHLPEMHPHQLPEEEMRAIVAVPA